MSLRDQAWWPEFCARLRTEPLERLARVYGHTPTALAVALNMGDDGGPATEQFWWPEAVRRYKAGESLREISRLLGVNLRRLRRGLARAGLRVSGEDLGEEGVRALVPYRDRLGKEPDGAIAAEAGLPVEAVQGERRRLGIAPYRNVAGAEGTRAPAAEAPGPPPEPVKAVESRPAPPEPAKVVESRPASTRAPEAPTTFRRVVMTASAPPEPTRPTPPLEERRSRFADARPEPSKPAWREEPRGGPTVVSRNTFRRSASAEPTVVRRPSPGGRVPPPGRGDLPPSEDQRSRDLPPEEGDLSALTSMNRERRGRMRLIRPDAVLPAPEPEPEVRAPRKKREPTHSPVRIVSPDELPPMELEARPREAALAPRVEPEARPAPEERPAPLRPTLQPLEPLPPEPEVRVRAPEPEPVVEPAPEPEIVALPPAGPSAEPEPALTAPVRAPAPRPARAPRPRPALPAPAPEPAAPAPAAPIVTAPVASTPPAPAVLAPPAAPLSASRAWLVRVTGRPAPLVILAADVVGATLRAAQELGPDEMRNASVVAVDVL